MKTTRRIFTGIILTLSTYLSFGQNITLSPSQRLEFQKRTISNSSFIFEGTAIFHKGYITTISITKIFKGSGQIKLGTINIIAGSRTDVDDGDSGINKEVKYIIFGNTADSSAFRFAKSPIRTDTTTNNFAIRVNDLIEINRMLTSFKSHKGVKNPEKAAADFPVAEWGNMTFKTLNELYAYLKEIGGLTVQEEVK
jgi:hypothetical protein